MEILRNSMLALAGNERFKSMVVGFPPSRAMVKRFVPGETLAEVMPVLHQLAAEGLCATVDHLGEFTRDATQAIATRDAYLELLNRVEAEGLADRVEVSVKLSAIGQFLPGASDEVAQANARAICARASEIGTTVTFDAEDHTSTDAQVAALRLMRQEFPGTGGVLQAYLFRTLADCREFAVPGSRIRLCKGAYDEPPSVAHQSMSEVRDAFRACLRVLMKGEGYPMVATHDPALIADAQAYAELVDRGPETFEFQFLYGVRTDEQRRLAREGFTVRVYVPYGADWYGYYMRRIAERPQNLLFLGRALLAR